MTPKERAAMQQALVFVESLTGLHIEVKEERDEISAALREALAEQADMNLNCKSVQARLATSWGYVKAEQAEQEPVGEMIDKAGYKGAAWYLEPPETGTKLYAAPARTKDLTDDELAGACGWKLGYPMYEWVVDIGRWAIAADREKNK